MKTTAEQRAALRRAYVIVGLVGAREVAVLDDLDEVMAERDNLEAEVARLRAVADAARPVAEDAHELDCATLEHNLDGEGAYARHWVPCDCSVAALRAALARLDGGS